MGVSFPTTQVQEGMATILVPTLEQSLGEHIDHARSKAPVFYNPVQSLNRDTAVLAMTVHQRNTSRPVDACEPMCGTGVRGVRLVLEVPEVEKVVMGDLSPSAIRLTEENARLNGVSDRVRVRLMDANLLLGVHSHPFARFDYVDVDPYGSPTPFIDSAVRACRNRGMIALTATDMAPLCGINPKACLRKYGGAPLQGTYCHEVALRLLAGALARAAAVHEIGVTPVFSYYADHYVRLYAHLQQGARRADRSLGEMRFIIHCPRCLHRKAVKRGRLLGGDVCERCGSQMRVAGPMWLGELANPDFSGRMLERAYETELGRNLRLLRLIELVRGEIGYPPTFHNIDEVCSRVSCRSLPTEEVLQAIRDAGFRVALTHFDRRGIKTDASAWELENLLKP